MQVAKTDATILMRMDSQMEDSLSTDPFCFFQRSDLIFFEELPPESPPANFQSPPRPHEDRPLDSILLCHLRAPHSLVFVCRQTFFCSHTWFITVPNRRSKEQVLTSRWRVTRSEMRFWNCPQARNHPTCKATRVLVSHHRAHTWFLKNKSQLMCVYRFTD